MFFTFQVFPLAAWEFRDLDQLPWSAPCLPLPSPRPPCLPPVPLASPALELAQVLVTASARSDKVSWLRAKHTSSQENSQQVWLLLPQIGGFLRERTMDRLCSCAVEVQRLSVVTTCEAVTLGNCLKCFCFVRDLLWWTYIHMYTHEKEHRGSLSLVLSKWKRCCCLSLLPGPVFEHLCTASYWV